MSFEEKLEKQFKNFQVPAPTATLNLEHIYVDYIELVAVFSKGNFVTASDIIDRLNDVGVLVVGDEIENLEIGSNTARIRDEHESWTNDKFLILEERSTLFGVEYPFTYENRKISIRTNLTYKQQLYIVLLLSSNLNLFKIIQSELTSDFEIISFLVLKNYLPTGAIVKSFGAHSDYTGTAIDKIKLLANDMKIEYDQHEIDNISKKNIQERGLDVVGWIPFGDSCPNYITILGQCACGKDWPLKQHDTRRFESYLRWYKMHPAHGLFIPYCLNNLEDHKRFYRSDDIQKQTLLFERKRIVHHFGADTDFNSLISKRVVEKCVAHQEDIV